MSRRRVAVALLSAWLAVGGCATNRLRLDDADAVERAAATASDQARAFLRTVDRAREETTIALVVADPACGLTRPQIRVAPDLDASRPITGSLCERAPAGEERRLSTAPLAPDLEPTLQLVEALGGYAAALADAADEESGESPTQPLLDALAIARAAAVTLHATSTVPAADDPRVTAAAALVDMLDQLAREAAAVRRLRAAVAARPRGAAAVLDPLERQIGSWERARQGDAGLRILVAGWATARVVRQDPPATPEARRAAMVAFYATRDAMAREAELAPALRAALEALRQADHDLRDVLEPRPRLSRADRRRVAALTRARLVAAFTHVAELASAIRST